MLGLNFTWYQFSITMSQLLMSLKFRGKKSRWDCKKCIFSDIVTLISRYAFNILSTRSKGSSAPWLPRKLWTACTNAYVPWLSWLQFPFALSVKHQVPDFRTIKNTFILTWLFSRLNFFLKCWNSDSVQSSSLSNTWNIITKNCEVLYKNGVHIWSQQVIFVK